MKTRHVSVGKENTLNSDKLFVFSTMIVMAFVVSVVFFAIGFHKRNEMIRFEKEKRLVQAIVVGYTNDDSSNGTRLCVSIPERNDNKNYSVNGWVTTVDYPPGKEINVWSMEKKVLGFSYPMLWISDKPIPTTKKASGVFFALSAVSFISMIVLSACIILKK